MYRHQNHRTRIWPVLLAAVSLVLSQLACNLTAPDSAPATGETQAPTPTIAAGQDTPPEPTVEQAEKSTQPAGPGMACLGSFGHGLTCLDETGWQTFSKDTSSLGNDLVKNVTICPDNRLLIAHALGINAFDGERWQVYDQGWGYGGVSALACDAASGIWVAHYGGVSYYDGSSWTTHPAKQLATESAATDLIKDVAVAPGGRIWVVTASSVATLDIFKGDEWTVFQVGQGFDDRYFFDKIAIDSQGHPWVVHSTGLLIFDGEGWTNHVNRDLFTVQSLAIDAQGRAWVGTMSKGVHVFADGGWSIYNIENSELGSNHVRAIVVDAQGRVWLGTEWGVYIVDGAESDWHAYRMDNADLADNDVRALAVVEAGPSLPEPVDKDPGSMSGRILLENEKPANGATVEICVEYLGSQFIGETPCAGQPFVRQAETDADGYFTIPDLPAGFYVITANTGDSWTQLTTDLGLASDRMLVEAGQETLLGEIAVISGE